MPELKPTSHQVYGTDSTGHRWILTVQDERIANWMSRMLDRDGYSDVVVAHEMPPPMPKD